MNWPQPDCGNPMSRPWPKGAAPRLPISSLRLLQLRRYATDARRHAVATPTASGGEGSLEGSSGVAAEATAAKVPKGDRRKHNSPTAISQADGTSPAPPPPQHRRAGRAVSLPPPVGGQRQQLPELRADSVESRQQPAALRTAGTAQQVAASIQRRQQQAQQRAATAAAAGQLPARQKAPGLIPVPRTGGQPQQSSSTLPTRQAAPGGPAARRFPLATGSPRQQARDADAAQSNQQRGSLKKVKKKEKAQLNKEQRERDKQQRQAQAELERQQQERQQRLQQELLRQLEDQQRRKQQQQQAGKPIDGTASPPALPPANQQEQQQQQRLEPGWMSEAAGVLCNLGMSAAQATQTLQAAHLHALRQHRQQHAAEAAERQMQAGSSTEKASSSSGKGTSGSSGGSDRGVSSPRVRADRQAGAPGAASLLPELDSASAAAASSQQLPTSQPPPPLPASQVEAVCQELVATAQVRIAELKQVLARAPELLACQPEELRKQCTMLRSVWRSRKELSSRIADYPAILSPEFPAALGRSLEGLSSLGFSRDQVSTAILRHPAVTELRRHDVVGHLRSAGLDLSDATGEVFQFLAEHPHLLCKEGAATLARKLQLFGSWRLAPPLRALVLARCPALLKEADANMQEVVDILLGYSMTWQQLEAVLLSYPAVLRTNPDVVRFTLKLLADFGIGLGEVVHYPRVFIHDPVNYVGPRLSYLRAYNREKLRQVALTTILCRSDDEFAAKVVGRLEDEYAVFKDAWIRQYYELVDMPAGRAGSGSGGGPSRVNPLSHRLWSREVTDELWL